jgi:hypothetical protein
MRIIRDGLFSVFMGAMLMGPFYLYLMGWI